MTKQYPVVLFLYKRPDNTKAILDIILQANINKIYIFADGPRTSKDIPDVAKVKLIINDFITTNPDIKVIPKYAQQNIGLRQNIVNGLNSIFLEEAAAIILEDDCMPSLDFFRFTSEMLSRYQDNNRIMSIAGSSVGSFSNNSYDFSKYQLCWGWATWARSWRHYDPNLQFLNTHTWMSKLKKISKYSHMRAYWNMMLRLVKAGRINTWDYQWTYSVIMNDGLAIIPGSNLVSNIGFDSSATNTIFHSRLARKPTSNLNWPLSHPSIVKENLKLSEAIEKNYYNNLIAIIGMLRQYFYWLWNTYGNRH